jgi:hypothetical protein
MSLIRGESEAARVQRTPNHKLWLRILSAYAGHHPAARHGVNDVSHT